MEWLDCMMLSIPCHPHHARAWYAEEHDGLYLQTKKQMQACYTQYGLRGSGVPSPLLKKLTSNFASTILGCAFIASFTSPLPPANYV